ALKLQPTSVDGGPGALARPDLMDLGRQSYRRRLPHYQADASIFVTFATKWRQPLPKGARDLVLSCCKYEDGRTIRLEAAVVMPDHVHLLLKVLRNENADLYALSHVIQRIKSASAHAVNKFLNRSGPVWQQEFFDRALRAGEPLAATVEYIEQNPVADRLVSRPDEYPWLYVAP